jgi:hypothetical protein
MSASSAMQKKRSDVRYATGLYPLRASSILISVSSAICCFSPISILRNEGSMISAPQPQRRQGQWQG